MKAKITRGAGFKGFTSYVANPEKGEHIGGTMTSIDPNELAKEFEAVRDLRPTVRNPVWHCSLSLPLDEKVTNQGWNVLTAHYMEKMGFSEKNPYTVFRHTDTDLDHVHIVASRINVSGEVWHGSHDVRRAIRVTQELEKKYGLTLTVGLSKTPKGKATPTKNEVEQAIRTAEKPPRMQIQDYVDDALRTPCTAQEFTERLKGDGVNVRQKHDSRTGELQGFSFEFKGIPFSGSGLGGNYRLEKLHDRGLKNENPHQIKEKPIKLQLRDIVDKALSKPCTAVEFCDKLKGSGVSVCPNIASTGHFSGFSFRFKGEKANGSDLGKNYRLAKLYKKGLSYDKVRDSEFLTELKNISGQRDIARAELSAGEAVTKTNSDRDLSADTGSRAEQPEPAIRDIRDSRTAVEENKFIEPEIAEITETDRRKLRKPKAPKPVDSSLANGHSRSDRGDSRVSDSDNILEVAQGEPGAENFSPEERDTLVEELQDIDELIHDYRQIHAELEAQLEDVIPPKRVDFKADEYSENSYEDLLETKEIREEILQDYRDIVWSLEDKVEKQDLDNDNDYGMSM